MAMKKIKSVKRNGVEYEEYGLYWRSNVASTEIAEWVHEDVILACPLFEVEFEGKSNEQSKDLYDLTRCYNEIQTICEKYKTKNPASN